MLIVDAQQNIAFNAQQLNRDYTRWAWHQRADEADPRLPPAAASLYDNLLGRVGLVFGGVAVIAESSPALQSWQRYSYRTQADARQLAMWQLDYYRRLADEQERARLVLNQGDLEAVLQSWEDPDDIGGRLQGIVIALKGAEPVREPKELEEWVELGLRVVAPAWGGTRYCAAAPDDGDLTALGYELLEAMADHGLLLDIAGMPARAAESALERYEGEVLASHACLSRFSAGARGLSDSLVRRLAERDGTLGLMVYNACLRPDWHPGDPKRRVTVGHWAEAVDYVCQLTGSAAHVGLGSNIDGGYPYRALPVEIDASCDLWRLRKALLEQGFAEADAAAILAGNFLRKLRQTLPED